MKAKKMNPNPQPKTEIKKHLEKFHVSIQEPKSFNKDNCTVNLEGFKSIQDSFVIDIDTEIGKKDSKIKCRGKRCDFILYFNQYCVLIEAKSGKNIKSKTIRQFESTYNYLKRQKLIYSTCIFLLVSRGISHSARKKFKDKKFPQQQKQFKKIKHVQPGTDIFEYLTNKINNK